MVNFQRKQRYGWEDLLTIMHLLRAPEGCPWDREQTHQSIRRNFLEETYEALDAIDRNDTPGMCEELGDVLLQVVFHSVMEEEQGRFTADDVVDGVAQKLVFRHTHVFGAAEAADSAQALEGWEAQKKKEKGFTSPADAVEAVPHTLPALWRAEKIVSRSVKADSTGTPLPVRWTSWMRKPPSCGRPWRPDSLWTVLTASGRSWATLCSFSARLPRCPVWTRRTLCTGPATNTKVGSAGWRMPPTVR